MEDDGFISDEFGRYDVKFTPLGDVNQAFIDKINCEEQSLVRLLFCTTFIPKCVCAEFSEDVARCCSKGVAEHVPPSCWKGLIKNVPGRIADLDLDEGISEDEKPAKIASLFCITVIARRVAAAPILVLVSLRYKGNVGSIVRSAVQSNTFQAIYIIDPVEEEGAKNNDRVKDDDVNYYSLMNAPLLPIKRFPSVSDFLEENANCGRIFLATALSDKAMNIYGAAAREYLCVQESFVLLGEENCGLPESLLSLEVCHHLRIPSLSASINVSCAFSVVLTCMIQSHFTAL